MARKESAEAHDYVSALPLINHFDPNMEVEDDENLEELGFVPSAVSEPRYTCATRSAE